MPIKIVLLLPFFLKDPVLQPSAQLSAQPSSARPSGAQARLKKRRRVDFPAGFKTHTVRESLADSTTLLL